MDKLKRIEEDILFRKKQLESLEKEKKEFLEIADFPLYFKNQNHSVDELTCFLSKNKKIILNKKTSSFSSLLSIVVEENNYMYFPILTKQDNPGLMPSLEQIEKKIFVEEMENSFKNIRDSLFIHEKFENIKLIEKIKINK